MATASSKGPLAGRRVIEIAGKGPGPFCGMVLSDLGADVIRVDRLGTTYAPTEVVHRGRRSIAIDLKSERGAELVRRLASTADAVIEGFRPGVAERLGIGPAECMASNRRLVYGRVTGWGQYGPRAQQPGHDINYLAVSGALHAIGRAAGSPVPPANLLADYGAGGMLLAVGLCAAMLHAEVSGSGQVVDAAMLDGTALLTAAMQGRLDGGTWRDERGANLLDTGCPFYDVYECVDGRFVSIGVLEPKFLAGLVVALGLAEELAPLPTTRAELEDPRHWPRFRHAFARVFASRTRDHWCSVLDSVETCFAPVLSLREAREDLHARARGIFGHAAGPGHPCPAPRFSGTPLSPPQAVRGPGSDTSELLGELNLSVGEIEAMLCDKVIE